MEAVEQRRVIIWISAGAASAVAGKIALSDRPDAVLAYTDPGSEHPDNARFLGDLEQWYGREIVRLKSAKYADTWQVWEERRFLVGPAGALCTAELKKRPRFAFEHPDDVQVFGYTADEQHRADRFRRQNPEVDLRTPLIERGLTKDDCLALLSRTGIELPVMYRLGYRNNNCVGCVKGGIGYWNKIRVDFPDVFERMSRLERTLNHTVLRDSNGAIWLDELDPSRGNQVKEPDFECSLLCANTEAELSDELDHRAVRA